MCQHYLVEHGLLFLCENLEDIALDNKSEGTVMGKMPILIVYDDDKEAFWTLAVDQKGPTESCVKWSVDRLEDSGNIGKSIRVKSSHFAVPFLQPELERRYRSTLPSGGRTGKWNGPSGAFMVS